MAKIMIRYRHGDEPTDVQETTEAVAKQLEEQHFIRVTIGDEVRLINRDQILQVFLSENERPKEQSTMVEHTEE